VSRVVRLGISTCPNDVFAFAGLLQGEVRPSGLSLEICLRDVEELNRGLAGGLYDVAKVSFHAALSLARELFVLPVGAAMGYGVGPLLLAGSRPRGAGPPRVLCPGEHTTATLLWRLFHGAEAEPRQVVFSEILPALERGEADLGVCIHEARFTYRQHGLRLVEDLGATWEEATGSPLPLGGLAARRELGRDAAGDVADAVAESIAWGFDHRERALETMRRHAQELADEVLWAHVELYVNERTRELGEEGARALAVLGERARSRGLVPPGSGLEILGR
jgi:1,4-dihydroxy-6-naphthoate synthase